MSNIKTNCYYTVEVPYNGVNSNGWDSYRGEGIGSDWWNYPSMRFNTEAEAEKAISESNDYKNCNWRIVRTTVTTEVTQELIHF